jgi:hypothetical protein
MNRRGFLIGATSLLTAPSLVRANSLDYVPRGVPLQSSFWELRVYEWDNVLFRQFLSVKEARNTESECRLEFNENPTFYAIGQGHQLNGADIVFKPEPGVEIKRKVWSAREYLSEGDCVSFSIKWAHIS